MHLQQGTFTIEGSANMQQAIGAVWDNGGTCRPVDDNHLLVIATVDQFPNVRAGIEKITNPNAAAPESVEPANIEATGDAMVASQATVGTTREGAPMFNQPGSKPIQAPQTAVVEPGSTNDTAPAPPVGPPAPRAPAPRIAPPVRPAS